MLMAVSNGESQPCHGCRPRRSPLISSACTMPFPFPYRLIVTGRVSEYSDGWMLARYFQAAALEPFLSRRGQALDEKRTTSTKLDRVRQKRMPARTALASPPAMAGAPSKKRRDTNQAAI